MKLVLPASTLVWMLGVTQIVGYGSLYYAFAILAHDMAADFDWPVSRAFGVFSLALLCGGMVAPLAGRWMDRFGAPGLMAVGSVASTVALLAVASASGPYAFTLALVVMACVSTFVLYDAAFTALVQTGDPAARLRITHLTLIAGFASTIFWPLTSWLDTLMDWRSILLLFAALNLLVCAPLHAVLTLARTDGQPGTVPSTGQTPSYDPGPALPPDASRRAFLLVAVGFALSGFLLSALLAQMVPALTALGLGSTALVVSTIFGPSQVLVRFVNMIFGVRRHPLFVTIVGMSMFPVAVVILALTAPDAIGAAVFAMLLGFGSGLKSIVQGTLPLALFGTASYGSRLGRMALARQFLAAIAPFAFASQLELQGPAAALATLAVVGCLGVLPFLVIARMRRSLGESPADEVRAEA